MDRTPMDDFFDPVFVPPHENSLVIGTLRSFFPWIGRFYAHINRFVISDPDLARLRALRDTGAIFAANHPTREDPIVLFWLSKLLDERFNYLAAREALVGMQGWVMTRVGAYSILPGVSATRSIHVTSRLLTEDRRKIVIFPEGDIDDCDNTLLPFHCGVTQLGFWALEALERAGRPLAMPVVPLAIKYDYPEHTLAQIDIALDRLESGLKLSFDAALPRHERLLRIHERVIARLEYSERIRPAAGATVEERAENLRENILRRIAGFLHVESCGGEAPLPRQALTRSLMRWTGVPGKRGLYLQRLHDHRVELALSMNQDLQRLQNLEATRPSKIAAPLELDRFVAIVERLELEVFGHVCSRPMRRATVRVGEFVPLEKHYAQYRIDRHETSLAVTRVIEDAVRAILQPSPAASRKITLVPPARSPAEGVRP